MHKQLKYTLSKKKYYFCNINILTKIYRVNIKLKLLSWVISTFLLPSYSTLLL